MINIEKQELTFCIRTARGLGGARARSAEADGRDRVAVDSVSLECDCQMSAKAYQVTPIGRPVPWASIGRIPSKAA